MTFVHAALEPVKVERGAVRRFQNDKGAHLWPSNFFVRHFYVGGLTVPSVEHYYQSMKTLDRGDRYSILTADTPGQSKRMGRKVLLRSDWPHVMNTSMWTALHEKFAPDTDLAEALLATGDVPIIEGNTWHDNIWGDCTCGRRECRAEGQNRLGRMLVRRREILLSLKG